MFGYRSRQDWIAAELAGIREGVGAVRADIAAMGADLKSLKTDQTRQEAVISRLDEDVRILKQNETRLVDMDGRMKGIEAAVNDLKGWKIAEGAKWTGPQKLIAGLVTFASLVTAVAALTPVLKLMLGS